jgi:hypothetical protein
MPLYRRAQQAVFGKAASCGAKRHLDEWRICAAIQRLARITSLKCIVFHHSL